MVKGGEQGSEIVQFVVATPLFLLLVFSIIQVGGMMLCVNQVSSDITRACRQVDCNGLEQTLNKDDFIKREILGSATQLLPGNLHIDNVKAERKLFNKAYPHDFKGTSLQRTSAMELSYELCYEVPSFLDLAGLSGKKLSRHVACSYLAGKVIELQFKEQP